MDISGIGIVDYAGSLGKISNDQFGAALQRLNLGDFINAEKVPCGVVGQNVFLTTSQGEFVFRGRPFYDEQLDVEKFMVDNLHKHTAVPVAYPYLIDSSTDIFGWKYAIIPRLKGIQIANGSTPIIRFSKEERLKIVRAMVEVLVEMQKYTLKPGEYYNPIKPLCFEYSDTAKYAEHIINKITGSLDNVPQITDDDIKFINATIDANKKALLVPFEPCFVMGDFKEDNVLFANTHDVWKVCGVFDFATSHFGDGEEDISRMYAIYIDENVYLAKEFISEYKKRKPTREGFAGRLKIYSMRERIEIWSWAKNMKNVWWDNSMSLRKWLEVYLNDELI